MPKGDGNRVVFNFTGLNANLAYLLGVYMGDGYVYENQTGQAQFSLKAVDIDFLEKVQKIVEDIFQRPYKIKFSRSGANERSKDQYVLTVCSTQFAKWLVALTGKKDHIPYEIMSSNIDIKKAFFLGLMDSEGCVTARKITPEGRVVGGTFVQFGVKSDWIFAVHQIAEELGAKPSNVFTSKGFSRFTMPTSTYYEVGLGFSIKRKQSILEREAQPRPRKKPCPRRTYSFTSAYHPSGSVEETLVLTMRSMFKAGIPNREICNLTNVPYHTVYRITRNQIYKKLKILEDPQVGICLPGEYE